jgi:predicted metal-binding protein
MKTSRSIQYRVFVCNKRRHSHSPEGSCQNCGSLKVYQAFQEEIQKLNLQDQVEVRTSGCLDRCEAGVVVLICQTHQEKFSWLPKKIRIKLRNILFPNKCLYGNLSGNDVPDIVRSHFLKRQPLKKYQL